MDMKVRIVQAVTLMAIVGVLVIAPTGLVHAQGDITGAVAVSIADEQGEALPGVSLSLKSDAITLSGITGADGRYRFALVQAGLYTLRADLSGFAPAGMDNITVDFGSTYSAELILTAGEFTGEVTVTAAPPQIDTSIPTTKDSMTSEFIQNIPLRDRNFEELVNLMPGVAAGMVQGSRTTATGYRIDGASNVDPYGSGVAITFSQSAITPNKLHYFATLEYRQSDVGGVFAETTTGTDTILGSFKLNWLQNNSNQWTFFTALNKDDVSDLVLGTQFIAPEHNANETDDRFMLSESDADPDADAVAESAAAAGADAAAVGDAGMITSGSFFRRGPRHDLAVAAPEISSDQSGSRVDPPAGDESGIRYLESASGCVALKPQARSLRAQARLGGRNS